MSTVVINDKDGAFLSLHFDDFVINLKEPVYEANGQTIGGQSWVSAGVSLLRDLQNGGREVQYQYIHGPFRLTIICRTFPNSPVARFRYRLDCCESATLTKSMGEDNILYTGLCFNGEVDLTEILLSQFDTIVHSFLPTFDLKTESELEEGIQFPGPIALAETQGYCCLMAYEHGAEYPDSYLMFKARKYDEQTAISIHARKGNYYNGQSIDKEHPLESPWFHVLGCTGSRDTLFCHYREFFLRFISENTESRKPYIFYNTWNKQERNRYYHNLPYLHSMNLQHTLAEIDTAAAMGVDVFVIDTGWFIRTGDWVINQERFPDGMQEVRKKLDKYGMKLGLWFNPIVAADSSRINTEHPEYRMSIDGKENYWGKIWETEESWGMCLASGYADHFIKTMVRLYQELGVTYFKWDAIGQYGCNSPNHDHGTQENSPQERLDCYSYQMGLEMIRIVEEVSKVCPDAIVDFDITEGGRFVGLGFLSVGKYFLMNNGPYFSSFDIPPEHKRLPDTINVFFHPGAARGRVCRQGIKYDSFIPSILFLTHFLPDGPAKAQRNALASLVLGGNGIWGDLSAMDAEGIALFRDTLEQYKAVAPYVTANAAKTKGFLGSSPEIHAKLDLQAAKGVICFFTRGSGVFEYITDPVNREMFTGVNGADSWEFTPSSRLRITVRLEQDDARVVFIQ